MTILFSTSCKLKSPHFFEHDKPRQSLFKISSFLFGWLCIRLATCRKQHTSRNTIVALTCRISKSAHFYWDASVWTSNFEKLAVSFGGRLWFRFSSRLSLFCQLDFIFLCCTISCRGLTRILSPTSSRFLTPSFMVRRWRIWLSIAVCRLSFFCWRCNSARIPLHFSYGRNSFIYSNDTLNTALRKDKQCLLIHWGISWSGAITFRNCNRWKKL